MRQPSDEIAWAQRVVTSAGFSLGEALPDDRLGDLAFDAVRGHVEVAVRTTATSLAASFDLALWRTDTFETVIDVLEAHAAYGRRTGRPYLPGGVAGRWYIQLTNAVGLTLEEQQQLIRKLDPEPVPT